MTIGPFLRTNLNERERALLTKGRERRESDGDGRKEGEKERDVPTRSVSLVFFRFRHT